MADNNKPLSAARAALYSELNSRARANNTRRSYGAQVAAFLQWREFSGLGNEDREYAAEHYIRARCGGDIEVADRGGNRILRAFSGNSLGTALAALRDIGCVIFPDKTHHRGLLKIIQDREAADGGRVVVRARVMGKDEIMRIRRRISHTGMGQGNSNEVAARNEAIVMLGFCAMMRPVEIYALANDDISRTSDSLVLRFPKRKNWTHPRAFSVHLLPAPDGLQDVFDAMMIALSRWEIVRAGLPGNKYFCHCRGKRAGAPLSGGNMLDVLLRRHADYNVDVSGYCLRRGGCVARLMVGQHHRGVMKVGGWKSTDAFSDYGYAA